MNFQDSQRGAILNIDTIDTLNPDSAAVIVSSVRIYIFAFTEGWREMDFKSRGNVWI